MNEAKGCGGLCRVRHYTRAGSHKSIKVVSPAGSILDSASRLDGLASHPATEQSWVEVEDLCRPITHCKFPSVIKLGGVHIRDEVFVCMSVWRVDREPEGVVFAAIAMAEM